MNSRLRLMVRSSYFQLTSLTGCLAKTPWKKSARQSGSSQVISDGASVSRSGRKESLR